jgi:dienelactone hydrolase
MPGLRREMICVRRSALFAALILFTAVRAAAAPATTVVAAAQEIVGVPTVDGATLRTRVFRPAGQGPFPLAIISHGSTIDASQRLVMDVPVFAAASNWLLQHGYMVALPLRRGYGEAGGPWRENYGSCSNPDYYRAGLVTADDIQAAVEFFRTRPEVARDRVLLIGQSAGGWGSIATASRKPAGVIAVLNFAGGRGGNLPGIGNCMPQRLVEAAGRYGASARIPSLWLYSANDKFFAPDLSHKMFDAFVRAGGKADYVALPAFGTDGHRVFADAPTLWQPPVEAFLATINAR